MALKILCGAGTLLEALVQAAASWDGVCYWQRVVKAAVVGGFKKIGYFES